MAEKKLKVDKVAEEEIKKIGKHLDEIIAEIKDVQESVGSCLDAVKELTKVTGDLAKENSKWFRAGKM